MFRFEDNVAKYLVNESRDFQLMTRIYDILYMGQRADVSTLQELNSASKCKNSVLHLLADKVGFFTDKYIDERVLRSIVSSFKFITKHKGTLYAVMEAAITVLKAENTLEKPTLMYTTHDSREFLYEYQFDESTSKYILKVRDGYPRESTSHWKNNNIAVRTSAKIQNVVALEELLKYVVPFGFTFSIEGGAII